MLYNICYAIIYIVKCGTVGQKKSKKFYFDWLR